MGAALVVRALADAQAGNLRPVKQPQAGITYAHKIDKAEAAVNWCQSADEIGRRVRAFNPFPAASAQLGADLIKLWRVTVENVTLPNIAPGTVLKDYSGNNLSPVTVDGSSQVSITVTPRGGQGWVCYAPFNADVQVGVDPLQFSGTVSDMAWIVPGGRDGVAKPRTLRRVGGNSVTIDVRFAQPAQGGETVNNVLVKWGQGRNLNVSAADFTGKDVVTGGSEQATQIAPGHWRLVADISGMPEGLHNIKARVFNGRSGKPALFQTFSETVYVDRAGPDLAFENLSEGGIIEGARVVTVNNPDRTLYNLTYSIDGGAPQQADMVIKGRWRINLDGLSAGGHSITLTATEADYGNPRSVINTSTLTRGFTDEVKLSDARKPEKAAASIKTTPERLMVALMANDIRRSGKGPRLPARRTD
jgi:hypothetical protein